MLPDLLNWGDKRWKIIWKKFSNFTNFKCLNAWVVTTWKQSTSRWFSVRRNVQAQNEARNVNLRILRFIFVQTLLYTLTSLCLVHGCHLQQEWIVGYLDLETGKVKWNTIKALQFHVCNSRKQQKLEIEVAVFLFPRRPFAAKHLRPWFATRTWKLSDIEGVPQQAVTCVLHVHHL